MKKLRILVPFWSDPNLQTSIPLIMSNVFSILEKQLDFEVLWFLYMPEKISITLPNPNNKILHIQDFKDALDVLNKEKPDLVLASPSFNFVSLSFCIAAKKLKIPVISGMGPDSPFSNSMKNTLGMLLESTTPIDSKNSEKYVFRRGKYIISKLFFLLKTQFVIEKNPFKIFQLLFLLLYKYLKNYDLAYELKFASNFYWVTNQKVKNQLIQNGFESNKITVTGNPMHDKLFEIPKNLKKVIKNDKKINILFAPNPMYEHGFADKQSQFDAVEKIIKAIWENNDKFNLVIKIHPHSSKLFEYQEILNKINSEIPIFQKGIATNFLNESDVLITFTSGSIILNSILLGKPVVIYNFTNFQNDPYISNELAYECSLQDNLLNIIEESLLKGINKEGLDSFIQNQFFSLDGKSSERVSKVIMDFVKSHDFSSNN